MTDTPLPLQKSDSPLPLTYQETAPAILAAYQVFHSFSQQISPGVEYEEQNQRQDLSEVMR